MVLIPASVTGTAAIYIYNYSRTPTVRLYLLLRNKCFCDTPWHTLGCNLYIRSLTVVFYLTGYSISRLACLYQPVLYPLFIGWKYISRKGTTYCPKFLFQPITDRICLNALYCFYWYENWLARNDTLNTVSSLTWIYIATKIDSVLLEKQYRISTPI